jgi:hypothetical protein
VDNQQLPDRHARIQTLDWAAAKKTCHSGEAGGQES